MGRSRSSAASFNTGGCVLCLILIFLLVLSPGIAARRLAGSGASHVGVHPKGSPTGPSALGKNNNPAAAGNAISYGALKTCNRKIYQNCLSPLPVYERACNPYERCRGTP